MGKLHTVWEFIRRYKYQVTIIFFIFLIGFGGESSCWSRYQLQQQIHALEDEKQTYKDQYEENTRQLEKLRKDPAEAERVARERYFMKRSNEEVYVLLSPEAQSTNDSIDTDETAE